MKTKNTWILVGIFAWLVTSGAPRTSGGEKERAWGAEVEGWRLSVTSDKDTYDIGEPITLSTVLKNFWATPAPYRTRGIPELDYKITVALPTADWIPYSVTAALSEEGRRLTDGKRSIGNRGWSVSSGQEIKDDINLSRLYEMKVPGRYRITVTSGVPKRYDKGGVPLTSNEISITLK